MRVANWETTKKAKELVVAALGGKDDQNTFGEKAFGFLNDYHFGQMRPLAFATEDSEGNEYDMY